MKIFILLLSILSVSTENYKEKNGYSYVSNDNNYFLTKDQLKEESNNLVQKWMKFKTTYSK